MAWDNPVATLPSSVAKVGGAEDKRTNEGRYDQGEGPRASKSVVRGSGSKLRQKIANGQPRARHPTLLQQPKAAHPTFRLSDQIRPHEKEHEKDDQNDADDSDAAVTVAIAVAAELATEATNQEDDENDDKISPRGDMS